MQDKFKTYYGFCRNFLWQAREDNITGLAAQLAYYFLLSIFPFLIFMITLIGYTPLKTEDVLGLIKQYAPGVNLQIITQNIRSVLEQRNTGLLSFGIIAAVWSASNALSAMMNALDRAYKVEGKRSFLKARSVAV
ncbi:MAG: YihY/virulence factor BrkB family protein, partial [Desulfoferrobacter sp.]